MDTKTKVLIFWMVENELKMLDPYMSKFFKDHPITLSLLLECENLDKIPTVSFTNNEGEQCSLLPIYGEVLLEDASKFLDRLKEIRVLFI